MEKDYYTIFYILHTIYYILYTIYYRLRTIYYTLYIIYAVAVKLCTSLSCEEHLEEGGRRSPKSSSSRKASVIGAIIIAGRNGRAAVGLEYGVV